MSMIRIDFKPRVLGFFLIMFGMTPYTAVVNAASEVDFSGKTVRIELCVKPGGGQDRVSRYFFPEVVKRLPGQPDIVMQYSRLMYGSTNRFYERGKTNGLHILSCNSVVTMGEVLGRSDVKFNSAEFKPIFVLPNPEIYLIRSETGYNSPKDLTSPKVDLVYGHRNPGSPQSAALIFLDKMLEDVDIKFVFGYSGGETQLAFLRGETNIMPTPPARFFDAAVQDEIKAGNIKPLAQSGIVLPDGSLKRHPRLPDIPTIQELIEEIQGKPISGPEWKIISAMAANLQISLQWFLHQDTPDEIWDAWIKAANETLQDPKVVEGSKKVVVELPITGRNATDLVSVAVKIPDDVAKLLRDVLSSEFNLKFD